MLWIEVAQHDAVGALALVLAVPFLTVLAPSRRANEADGKRHKTSIDWTCQLLKPVSRWLHPRRWFLLGDGGFACVRLALACSGDAPVALVSRLRLDARLYHFPAPGTRGRKPGKGRRKSMTLGDRVEFAERRGKEVTLAWYGGERKRVRLLSGVCLWHTPGFAPVPIRWVLVVDPSGKSRPEAFFSTDRTLAPQTLVEYYVLRWNVEVTFEEGRRHLGLETQRQWSERAIARTTPVLLGLFSLVCLQAHILMEGGRIPPRCTAWYLKPEATFSDVLALVRRALWAGQYLKHSTLEGESMLIHPDEWEALLDQLASTA